MKERSGSHVDIDLFRKEFEMYLKKGFGHLEKDIDHERGNYKLKNKQYEIEIELDDKIISYELFIKKEILGLSVGIGEDTGIYPIKGEPYESVALGIYNNMYCVLDNIVNDTILIGGNKSRAQIAWLNTDGLYSLKKYKKILWGVEVTHEERVIEDIIKLLNLKPLSYCVKGL